MILDIGAEAIQCDWLDRSLRCDFRNIARGGSSSVLFPCRSPVQMLVDTFMVRYRISPPLQPCLAGRVPRRCAPMTSPDRVSRPTPLHTRRDHTPKLSAAPGQPQHVPFGTDPHSSSRPSETHERPALILWFNSAHRSFSRRSRSSCSPGPLRRLPHRKTSGVIQRQRLWQ